MCAPLCGSGANADAVYDPAPAAVDFVAPMDLSPPTLTNLPDIPQSLKERAQEADVLPTSYPDESSAQTSTSMFVSAIFLVVLTAACF